MEAGSRQRGHAFPLPCSVGEDVQPDVGRDLPRTTQQVWVRAWAGSQVYRGPVSPGRPGGGAGRPSRGRCQAPSTGRGWGGEAEGLANLSESWLERRASFLKLPWSQSDKAGLLLRDLGRLSPPSYHPLHSCGWTGGTSCLLIYLSFISYHVMSYHVMSYHSIQSTNIYQNPTMCLASL